MPSSPGYQRDYHHEYVIENAQRRRFRAERNAARRQLMKEGKVHKGDNKDVDHKQPLSKGGSNSRSNLRTRSSHANRSYHRTSSGAMKNADQS